MKRARPVRRAARAALAALALLTTTAAGDRQPAALAIEHVTLIDGTLADPMRDATVLVRGSRIAWVGPAARARLPLGTRRIHGRGRTLIPGLWDMHVHLDGAGPRVLGILVAHGVTGVRDMGGSPERVARWRDEIASGARVGPHIRFAGPIIENGAWIRMVREYPEGRELLDGSPRLDVSTPGDAVRAVDSLVRLGVDFVKVRTSPPDEALVTLGESARGRGLALVGHVPTGRGGVERAMRARFRTIEHIDQLEEAVAGLIPEARRQVFRDLARRGTGWTPTLVSSEGHRMSAQALRAWLADSSSRTRRQRCMTPELRAFWRRQLVLREHETPRDWSRQLARSRRLLRELRAANVTLLVGTDLGALGVVPGESLADELALLVDSLGVTPLEAIASATGGAARAQGLADSLGTIAVGHRADLVLLERDPLVDVRAACRPNMVVLAGRLFDRRALDALVPATPRDHRN